MTQKPRVEQPAKVHREANGVYTQNRRGVTLCAEFQSGNCASTTGIYCPRVSRTAVCVTSTMDTRAISHHVSQVMEKDRKKKAKERTDEVLWCQRRQRAHA